MFGDSYSTQVLFSKSSWLKLNVQLQLFVWVLFLGGVFAWNTSQSLKQLTKTFSSISYWLGRSLLHLCSSKWSQLKSWFSLSLHVLALMLARVRVWLDGVCQMEACSARQPGTAAVPLCVVRAQCVLSAAVSNSQLTRQRHPRWSAAADGTELLTTRVCACLLFL